MAFNELINDFKTGKIFKKQWPWWMAGVATGLAEAINFWLIPSHGKHEFIGVTTGMAKMLAGFESTLFGTSLIATKPDYQPTIQWIILGAILSGIVLSWLEGEFRDWAVYPKKFLLFTALGAFMFALGTRIDGGCTLHHLLGGWAAMNIKSYVVMITATIAAMIGFYLLSKLGLVQYFKAQETKYYVKEVQSRGWAGGLTLVNDYDPKKDWIRLALYAFWVIFGLAIIYNAIFGNYYAVKMGWAASLEETQIYHAMLTLENLPKIILLLIVGGLLGAAVAKTGFGTECAILNFEMGQIMAKDEKAFARKWKTPFNLRTLFIGMLPFTAFAVHIIIASTAFFIGFAAFGIMEGHHWFLSMGVNEHTMRNVPNLPLDILGGFLLGMGTIFMIGCEFRNYGRTGLLYITGLLIWPFFYLGYLPYTLARDFWDGIMTDPRWVYSPTTFLPALITPDPTGQAIIWLLYILLWVVLLYWGLRFGAKHLGVTITDLLTKNSEELYLARIKKLEQEHPEEFAEIDKLEKELAQTATPNK
ncbi:MAG: YeeE/YedE thiosulfate transporter family protein [Candidatus Asgardarchaeia archaeon]